MVLASSMEGYVDVWVTYGPMGDCVNYQEKGKHGTTFPCRRWSINKNAYTSETDKFETKMGDQIREKQPERPRHGEKAAVNS